MGKRPAAERAALGCVQRLLSVRVAEDVPARRKVGLPLQRLPARIAVGHRAEAEAPENGENDWAVKPWRDFLLERPREVCFGPGRHISAPGGAVP